MGAYAGIQGQKLDTGQQRGGMTMPSARLYDGDGIFFVVVRHDGADL